MLTDQLYRLLRGATPFVAVLAMFALVAGGLVEGGWNTSTVQAQDGDNGDDATPDAGGDDDGLGGDDDDGLGGDDDDGLGGDDDGATTPDDGATTPDDGTQQGSDDTAGQPTAPTTGTGAASTGSGSSIAMPLIVLGLAVAAGSAFMMTVARKRE